MVGGIKNVLEELRKNERTVFAWSAVWDKLKEWGMLLSLFLALVLGGGTTTKYVEVERVRTDTLYQSRVEKDSVWLHDSIHVKERGDTVWVERWHTKNHATELHDTVYQATHDTIPLPYPVEKVVEKEKALTWWQNVRLTFGDIALFTLALMLVFWIVKSIVMKFVIP